MSLNALGLKPGSFEQRFNDSSTLPIMIELADFGYNAKEGQRELTRPCS